MEVTRLDRQPAVLAGTFLVDAHVHCHAGVDPALFLTAAAEAFAGHAREESLAPAAGVLLFTEVAEARVFETLRAAGTLAGWRLERNLEDVSLIAHGPGEMPLILIAGRQIVTAEGLEVLALGAAGPFADRLELGATVEAVQKADGVPVLPWGFGKWWGARGKALARFLERAQPGTVFLGDNGGRLGAAPAPALFARAAARGIVVLPGSDALPLAAEATKVGSYGFVLEGELDPARPAAGLKRLIRALRAQPPSFGRLQALLPFLGRQLAMQWRNRSPVR